MRAITMASRCWSGFVVPWEMKKAPTPTTTPRTRSTAPRRTRLASLAGSDSLSRMSAISALKRSRRSFWLAVIRVPSLGLAAEVGGGEVGFDVGGSADFGDAAMEHD